MGIRGEPSLRTCQIEPDDAPPRRPSRDARHLDAVNVLAHRAHNQPANNDAAFSHALTHTVPGGTAPLEASSGRIRRQRLNRGGNRQLNKAIHIAATTQIARPDTEGRRYYEQRLKDGKTKREAIRALKRQTSNRIWTALNPAESTGALT